MEITSEQKQKIADFKIRIAIMNDGTKRRIFLSNNGVVCYFPKGMKRRGYPLNINEVTSLIEEKEKTEIDIDQVEYKIVAKFRKQALKAKFKNSFIESCINLPATFEKWVVEGKKSAYHYSITTGCSVTGQLITIESFKKHLPDYVFNNIKNAIETQTSYSTHRFPYNGYEGSFEFKKEENGDFRGWFNKEYKNCGNGYYYLLINEENFIGYDKD